MKKMKLVLSLFVAVLALNITAQEAAPVITFDKEVHDWGVINEGDSVETDFTITNTGKTDLIITKIKGSCGCTVPTGWSKEPIAPGATSSFHVKFNSRGKPNAQQKTVTVYSNTAKGRDFVKIKAQVTPDPKQEIIRKERREKRRVQAEARRASKAKLGANKEVNETRIKAAYSDKEKAEYDKRKENKEREIKRKSKHSLNAVKRTDDKKERLEKQEKRLEKTERVTEKRIEKSAKKADRKIIRTEKEIKRAEKARKKAAKKASKALKLKEKAQKKADKIEKKKLKIEKKIAKATETVEKLENKLIKMQDKFNRKEARGDLSPNDAANLEVKIKKQESKINKAKAKLQKVQRKLR